MVDVSFGSSIQNPQDPSSFVYERQASGTSSVAPIAAHSAGTQLINWVNQYYPNRVLILEMLGSDQHDNSVYTWIIDDVTLELSGPARAGSIEKPFVFSVPITVRRTVQLLIDNDNGVAYPNAGPNPSDATPYEGLFIGHWGS